MSLDVRLYGLGNVLVVPKFFHFTMIEGFGSYFIPFPRFFLDFGLACTVNCGAFNFALADCIQVLEKSQDNQSKITLDKDLNTSLNGRF